MVEAEIQKRNDLSKSHGELGDELNIKFTSTELQPLYLLAHFLADAN